MNDIHYDIDNLLDEEENNSNSNSSNQKGCCCKFFYYLFCCCCCCTNNKNSKAYYIKTWQSYLEKESNNKNDTFLPFDILTNLYAHGDDVLKELKAVRLNPNLLCSIGKRNDLEFYIPQLCTFLIFGAYEQVEQLFSFLCNACFASVFFAHRFYWFLRSLSYLIPENKTIERYLLFINAIFQSDNRQVRDIIKELHVSNSGKYVQLLKGKKCDYFLSSILEEIETENMTSEQYDLYNSFIKMRKIIDEYSGLMYEYADSDNRDKTAFGFTKTIEPYQILVSNYLLHTQSSLIEEIKSKDSDSFHMSFSSEGRLDNNTNQDYRNNHSKYTRQNKKCNTQDSKSNDAFIQEQHHDINLLSFMSCIDFYDQLCNIGHVIINKPIDEQMKYIMEEITKINKILPSNVYLPFLKNSTRNYFICHIPVTEIKIFRTKTRAPILLTFELLRLDEVITAIAQKDGLITAKVNSKHKKKDKHKDIRKNNHTIIGIDGYKDYERQSSLIIEEHRLTTRMIHESEITLSKPVTINLLNQKIASNEINRLTRISLNDFNENQVIRSRTICDFDFQFKKKKSDNHLQNNITNNAESLDINELTKKYNQWNDEQYETDYRNKNNHCNNNDDQRDNNSDTIITNENQDNIKQKEDQLATLESIKEIFGESSTTQNNPLKVNSPFANFTTWTTFKVIIKAGEDLRQEQFATQLINEFSQIFRLEKVNCWVNPYEILTTGRECGLIEMVLHSISLDQLKRKTSLTLKQFFILYFGKEFSQEYKQAVRKFIRSLAGYSLVCYFLQIKDRHNGNILLDNEGHIIHIDFGFMLSNAPGKGLKFEQAPFKLTEEILELLDGINSENFKKFRKLLIKGYNALYKHCEKIVILTEMMYCGHGTSLPCFEEGENTLALLKERFKPQEDMGKIDKMTYIDDLLQLSIDNWTTGCYDKFQYYFQGIFY